MKNKKVIISIVLTVAIISVAGVFYAKKDKPAIKVPQSMEEMRDFADSNEFKALDGKTRREVMHKAMEQQMDTTLTEYFALAEKDRTAYLDEVIDRMGQMRQQWRERRDPNSNRDERERPQGERRAPSAERMRQRTESMDPQKLAKMAEFMKAMQKRMGERGIQGGGPGGGFGGPGGRR